MTDPYEADRELNAVTYRVDDEPEPQPLSENEFQRLLELAWALAQAPSATNLIQIRGRRKHVNLFELSDRDAAKAMGWFNE